MKPFATGNRADAELLARVLAVADRAAAASRGAKPEPGRSSVSVAASDINPFFFREPLAPLIAARRERRRVSLKLALAAIRARHAAGGLLMVEGCGGLLTPLGPGYTARDLVRELGARVLVVAPDKLGVLNQVLLVLEALRVDGCRSAGVVLTSQARPDSSTRTNARLLSELIQPTKVFQLPYLGPRASTLGAVSRSATRHRTWLAGLAARLRSQA
jgi:dethiobiotin synthetase